MSHIRVFVTLKPALLDAQGRVVQEALHSLGFTDVQNLRVGKVIEMDLPQSSGHQHNMGETVEQMCRQFLANPVIEDFSYEVTE